MKQLANLPRHIRWAVPAGVLAVTAGVLAASGPASATVPALTPRTAAHLLAAAKAAASVPLTGTVTESASLGLPALPQEPGASALPSLLSGSNTIHVWYADQAHYRLAIPQRMSESDLIRNGASAWLWDSSANQVTHLALPPGPAGQDVPALPLTPQQAAGQALAQAGASTITRTDTNVTVAGQPAYQLVLAPRSSRSLIGEVRIAIDSAHNVPIRVQVFARGAGSPAVQVAYTSLSFGRPAASNFAFSPPPGATVVQDHPQGHRQGAGSAPDDSAAGGSSAIGSGSQVIGSGWLAVLELPGLPQSVIAGRSGGASLGPLGGSHHAAAGSSPGGSETGSPGLDTGAIVTALLRSARQVSGPWGSGRLLRTGLLSVLLTHDNRVLIGAVTPEVLYQDVRQHGSTPALGSDHAAAPAPAR